MKRLLASALATLALACSPPDDEPAGGEADLGLGDILPGDLKADGQWGAALECKPIPDLPALRNPQITISLQGLTLHLVDPTVGYDKVFPIGVGQIESDRSDRAYGESKSYWPVVAYRRSDFTLRPSTNTACKIWWTDPDTGQKLPVFAGLPFMSWSGSYGMHGPIDNYRAANGGNLRRGFVSHGCIRLEAADITEIYARTHTSVVPVHVQREPERGLESRVDVDPRWIGAECASDDDCPYDGGFCKPNPYSARGFCTARCDRYCADRAGYPVTFCVPDPDAPGKGMCVAKVSSVNAECRPYDHFQPLVSSRNSQPSTTANVCLPGSPGAIGDHCFFNTDCDPGNRCAGATAARPGLCTQSCTRYCPDAPGSATTFCVDEPALGGAVCVRQCTPSSNASECPAGTACVRRSRHGEPQTVRDVCEPL